MNYTNSDTNFILYHRTHYMGSNYGDRRDSFNMGFNPVNGDMYGKGLYGTYDIESQLRDNMIGYGDYIIECKIENTGKFIIFDPNLCKLSLREQLKKKLKHYNSFYKLNKDVIEQCDQLIKDKGYSKAALIMTGLKGFIQNVDGILFYGGGHDGNVIVVYNLDLINLSRYAVEDDTNRFQSYNDIQWYPLKNIVGFLSNNKHSEKYINKINNGDDIPIHIFKSLNDSLKNIYIDAKISKERSITDIEFDLCDEEIKKYYIQEICISKCEIDMTLNQFNYCNIKYKEHYIVQHLNRHSNIPDDFFNLCDDGLKDKYICHNIQLRNPITDIQFDWCDNELKEIYFKLKNEINMTPYQTEWYKSKQII